MMRETSTLLFGNTFVLSTARFGPQTSIRACDYFTYYTAGHETQSRKRWPARLNYLIDHIKVDSVIPWFIAGLRICFGHKAFNVHLKRKIEEIAKIYNQSEENRSGVVLGCDRSAQTKRDFNHCAARDMENTITAITDVIILPHLYRIEIDISAPKEEFAAYNTLGAPTDISTAFEEFEVRHFQQIVFGPMQVVLYPK
jgi:hypothetical protein